MGQIIPRHEEITGGDLSGSSGATNRTHTLDFENAIQGQFSVISNRNPLQQTTDYSFSGTTLTFLVPIYDDEIITIDYFTESQVVISSAGLKFLSVLNFTKHIVALGHHPGNDDDIVSIGTGDNTATDFFISKIGLIDGQFTISYGATATTRTDLTETTHYTIDLEISKITLTAAGVSEVGTDKIYADYLYNIYELTDGEVTRALLASENTIVRRSEQTFAEFTDDDPLYRKVVDEIFQGMQQINHQVYETYWQPIVKFATTVNGAYTTGGTSIVLDNAEGLPDAATIYIAGNKVAYTAKSSNTLIIPSTTPSIADGTIVRGEVIELSREAEGNDPSYTVLVPDQEYEIDYLQGRIQLLSNAFFGELNNNDVLFPSNPIIRSSYFNAWYEQGKNPEVPSDVEEVGYMIAAKKFTQRIVKKAFIGGNNEFNPAALNSGDKEIDEILEYYKTLNVSSSPFNKNEIS